MKRCGTGGDGGNWSETSTPHKKWEKMKIKKKIKKNCRMSNENI